VLSTEEVFMKALAKYLLVATAIGYYLGCAKKNFAIDQTKIDETCQAALGCTHTNGIDYFDYSTTVGGGQVDILFVDDNSGSMSFEQSHMADRFSNFLDALEAKSVDYRIGVTTTDISSASNPARSINETGGLQDGKLVRLTDGSYFLTPNSGTAVLASDKKIQRIQWFSNAIQRPETSKCETFLKANPTANEGTAGYLQNCPSGDERGIYAANLFVQQNPQSMIRPQAHLAVVILSDEDVRSSNYYKTNNLVLNDLDLPTSLISTVKSRYPDKTLSFHSIIVRPGQLLKSMDWMNGALADLTYDPINAGYKPTDYFSGGDTACLNAQFNQIAGTYISGSYGYLYAVLSRMTGGVEGDICANNYASQLSDIGNQISERVQELSLRCSNVSNLTVDVSPSISGLTHSLVDSRVVFSQVLPAGTKVAMTYNCPSAF
jgi:hypothetical protein